MSNRVVPACATSAVAHSGCRDGDIVAVTSTQRRQSPIPRCCCERARNQHSSRTTRCRQHWGRRRSSPRSIAHSRLHGYACETIPSLLTNYCKNWRIAHPNAVSHITSCGESWCRVLAVLSSCIATPTNSRNDSSRLQSDELPEHWITAAWRSSMLAASGCS